MNADKQNAKALRFSVLIRVYLRSSAASSSAANSRFVIRIAYYVADGGGAETGAYGHIEYADVFTRLGPLPCDGVAHGDEAGRKGHLIYGAGTVEPAGVLSVGLGQQLIAFRLLPTGRPIAETAGQLHGDASVNPEPRWGWRRFPGGAEAGNIAGAGREAGAGRKQFLGTAGMARDHQPRHGQQHPTSLSLHTL